MEDAELGPEREPLHVSLEAISMGLWGKPWGSADPINS